MGDIVFQRRDNICNLCKKASNLSWDHVPPKGSMMLTDMWVENHFKAMGVPDTKRVSQYGLKYKTICSECNSKLGYFDRAYIDFTSDIKKYLKMSEYLTLPFICRCKVNPVKIAKCVLGHILATNTSQCSSVNDQLIRDYVMGENTRMPDGIRLFYWFYDYNVTVVKTDIVELDINTGNTANFSVVKSFPIAFAICFDGKELNNTTELKILPTDTISSEREIFIDLRKQNSWNYPEGITDHSFHLVANDNRGIIATHKHQILSKKNKKRK